VREETLALLKETRATCVLVTHDPVEAMDFADRILLMRAGRLVQTGTSPELFSKPADLQVARFFSDVNEIAGWSVAA
jgi:iron(III) transport system ATP-binding protein